MSVTVRAYEQKDVPAMIEIWNEVVFDGVAFPQLDGLDAQSGPAFFSEQSRCGVAVDGETVVGLYILHPNNVGRCAHIANASYAVLSTQRGRHIGEALISDCLDQARALGFRILQFNAVVCSNLAALHLYEKLGFVRLGTVPGGFLSKDGVYRDIVLMYHTL